MTDLEEAAQLVMVDGRGRVPRYNLGGSFSYVCGGTRTIQRTHQITVHQKGNFYTTRVSGGRVWKFRPLPGGRASSAQRAGFLAPTLGEVHVSLRIGGWVGGKGEPRYR